MSDTFKLAKNLAKDAIGMSPEIEITKIKLPRRGGGLASLREMPVVYRQSGGPTYKLVETDIGLQEMFLGDDGNYYNREGFDERGLYNPRFDETLQQPFTKEDKEKQEQAYRNEIIRQTPPNVFVSEFRDPNLLIGGNMLQSPPSRAYTPSGIGRSRGIGGINVSRKDRPENFLRSAYEPNLIPTGDASLAEQITREQADLEREARVRGEMYGPSERSKETGISTVPMLDRAYQVEKSRTEYDPNLLIGGNMLQSPPTRGETVPDMSRFGSKRFMGRSRGIGGINVSRTPRTLLQSMAAYHQQREDREAKQAADREAEEAERARDAGRYGRGARPSPNAFQRAITTLMSGFQQPDKPATQGMVYGPISPDQMAMSQAAQQAAQIAAIEQTGGDIDPFGGPPMPTEDAMISTGGRDYTPNRSIDLSYMDTPEYQTEETWESYDPYGDYSVDMGGYYALKHGGGLSGIVKKFDGGDVYGEETADINVDFGPSDIYGEETSDINVDFGPDIYSDAPSVSSDLPDAAYMGDFAFAPDPQGRVGLMGPSEVAGVDIAQTYLSPDPESSELGQYEDVSGLERFIANLLPDSFSKTLGLSSAAQRFRSDADLARRPGYTKEDVAFEQNLNNLQNKFRNAMVTAKANRVNETSPKKDQEEAEKEATIEAAKDIFGNSFVENKGKGAPGFLATYGLGSLFKGMGLIGTAEINGVPVHVHDDGSITVISPENEPGYDDSLSVGSLAPEVPGVEKFKKELKKVEEETKEAAKESTVSLPPLTEGDKTRIRILMNNQGITEEEAKIRLNLQGRS